MPLSSAPRRSSKRGQPYHHGNLRQALVDAGIELLREDGLDALTLRAVARRAGVSQAAPYRHFSDRRALVAALAQQGFARLGESIGRAVRSGEPGVAALRSGMEAYVRFAHEHPAEYRVMFGAELARREDLPELATSALDVFGLLRAGIESMQRAGVLAEGDPGRMAITVWAMLHGLVMLSLDGQSGATGQTLDTLVEDALSMLVRGMRAERAQ